MGKVKLITFQSKEVLTELLSKGIYYADNSKTRESRDYSEDIEALGGHQPVWCFQIPEPLDLKKWYSGNYYLNIWNNEMSLGYDTRLRDFEMIELEVEDTVPLKGKTHNDYRHAVILPYLKLEWLVINYRISERFVIDDIGCPNPYYILNYIEKYNLDSTPLFSDNFHYLTFSEYENLKESLTDTLPLKSFIVESKIEPSVVYRYYNDEITKEEFHKIIGFYKIKTSPNPLE